MIQQQPMKTSSESDKKKELSGSDLLNSPDDSDVNVTSQFVPERFIIICKSCVREA
jgi:hypothetical protein